MRKLLWSIQFILLLLIGLSAGLIAWNLHTFSRLTDEAPIAKLRFSQIQPQVYQLELRSGDFCQPRTFKVFGDEWRLDARFLKWKAWANLFGLDAMYRLERLSGRYLDIDEENSREHQAHDIVDTTAADLTPYLEKRWLRWSPLDTYFGSSVYESMDPDYEYTVYRSQSGLLVRKQLLAPAHYEDGALVIHIEKDC
jgi:hypothetical protein